MKRTWYKLFLLFLLCFLCSKVCRAGTAVNYNFWSRVAVMHQGRVKPLDTFARVFLLMIYGRQTIKGEPAIVWLSEVLFTPEQAMKRKVADIRNSEVLAALKLNKETTNKYSFTDVIRGLQNNGKLLQELMRKERNDMSAFENQLMDLYNKTIIFVRISQSLKAFHRVVSVGSDELAAIIGVKKGDKLSYYKISGVWQKLKARLEKEQEKEKGKKDGEDGNKLIGEIKHVFASLKAIQSRHDEGLFTIIPPGPEEKAEVWKSPWSLFTHTGHDHGAHGDQSADESNGEISRILSTIVDAYLGKNNADFLKNTEQLNQYLYKINPSKIDNDRIKWEYTSNKWGVFYKSAAFYVTAFIFVCVGTLIFTRFFYFSSFVLIVIGLLFHFAGLGLRTYIMARPPVSTLYESIIFVGAMGVFFSLLVELSQKNGFGLLVASISGAVLHFIGFRYLRDGDSMGMLVAVLNSNFWLATHVITITIGYGCCYVAGLVGHLFLLFQIFKPAEEFRLSNLGKNMVGLSHFALFFTLLGTVLGGIWADQSWGRFWGWDPKENGALLICLWLLFLLHGFRSGRFKNIALAAGLVLLNVIVSLAWFGVNLLNVGLHTYGFTGSIAYNLLLFTGLEVLFILCTMPVAYVKRSLQKAPA
ncbi:cytochrome c biogenesis protein [Candidatus Riflebacteria bacterium]